MQTFEDFFGKLEELETVTGKDEDKSEDDFNTAFKMAYEALTNLADPVFSHWSTMLKCVEVFINNYIVIYHFVQAIKQRENNKAKASKSSSKSYAWQLSCALLSLMNTRSLPEDTLSPDSFVERFQLDSDEPNEELKLKARDSPMFYTCCCLLQCQQRIL